MNGMQASQLERGNSENVHGNQAPLSKSDEAHALGVLCSTDEAEDALVVNGSLLSGEWAHLVTRAGHDQE